MRVLTLNILRRLCMHEQRNEVRREMLQLSRVVHFERVALARDNIAIFIDAAEVSTEQPAPQTDKHHEPQFGCLFQPEPIVGPELRMGHFSPDTQAGEEDPHENQEDEIESRGPFHGVVPGTLAFQAFDRGGAVVDRTVLLLQGLDTNFQLLAISGRKGKNNNNTYEENSKQTQTKKNNRQRNKQ